MIAAEGSDSQPSNLINGNLRAFKRKARGRGFEARKVPEEGEAGAEEGEEGE